MVEVVNASIRLTSVSAGRKHRSVSSEDAGVEFTIPSGEEGVAQSPKVTMGQVTAANPVLLHQLGVAADEARDREARRHGQEVLDLLSELHRMLLRNRRDAGLCDRISHLVRLAPQAASPALAALTAGIVLRARVELARLAVLSSPQD